MPQSEYRVYAGTKALSDDQLNLIGDIRVDHAIGMATEAEVTLPVTTDDNGLWSVLEEDWVQPFKRLRIEIKVGDGDFVPLIDGPIVAQRVELHAGPGDSQMVLVVQDDSVLLNREEKVDMFEDRADSDIASQLIADRGLTPQVDDVPASGSALQRVVVQRGTNMQLLRELARRHGMFVYVKPGDAPGQSIGVFQRPQLTVGDLPEILLLGPDRNIGKFSAEFDALKPMTAQAGSVTLADVSPQTSDADSSSLNPLNGDAVHDVLTELADTMLLRTREEVTDLDEATQAAVNESAWAYSASVELDADSYDGVVTPYQVVRVVGVGGYLSGDYLVSRVTHLITDASYKQQVALRRNARSAGSDAAAPSVLAGVF
jgi:phage protein D